MYTNHFINDEFIVVNKKQDINFHSEKSTESLAAAVKSGENLPEIFPVHRLDRITSGLMIFARTKQTAGTLSALFKSHDIEKYYISISDRKPKKKQGMISGDMEKSRRGAWKLMRSAERPAKTLFFSKSCGNGRRLFVLKPLTGKTHQIRVAMKSVGAPVAGDPLYNKASSGTFDRAYLHAYALKFSLSGRDYRFTGRPEEGTLFQTPLFQDAFIEYESPWKLNWPVV